MAEWGIRFHHPQETSLPQKASAGRFVRPLVPKRRQPARSGTGWPESQPRRKTERARSPAQARAAGERKGPLPVVAERMVAPAEERRKGRVLSPALTAAATSGPVRRSWRSRRHGVAATPHPPGRMAHVRARRYLRQTTKCRFHPKGEQARRTRDKSGRCQLPHDRSYGSSYVPSIPVTLLPVIQRPAPGSGLSALQKNLALSPGGATCCPRNCMVPESSDCSLSLPGEGESSTLSRLRSVYKHRRASAIINSSCTESIDFPMAMRAEVAQW